MSCIDMDAFKMMVGSAKNMPADWHSKAARPFFCGNDVFVLLAFVERFKPKCFVEFGINEGKTAGMVLAAAPWIERYIGIEVPPGFCATLASQDKEVPQEAGRLVREDKRVELLVLRNGSRDVTPDMIAGVDMAFIDGDHSQEGVARDSMVVEAAMTNGGMILWHDYNTDGLEVRAYINNRNLKNGNRVCLVRDSNMCFEYIAPRA